MKKTMKKTWAVLLSLAMMFMLMLPAFAVTVDDAKTGATLNKLVKKADVALPEATFNFKFTNKAAPENALPAAKEAVTASFKTGEFAKYDKNTGLYASKKIVDIFAGKVDVMKRTPGVYKYEVTEEDPVYTPNKDELTKDSKKYNVYIRVDENGINGVWVEDEKGNKKDGTEDPKDMDPNDPASIKGCTFVDTYKVKTDDVDPDKPFDPEDAESYQFFTGNTVTGKYGDKELPFDYSVTLNNPTATEKLEAYVLKKGQKPSEGKPVTLEYGKKADVQLKDGEYLVIRKGLEPGTAFTVEQTAKENYTTKASLDGAPVEGLVVKGTVTADKNKKVQYVNTCDKEDKDVTPTGILIQNLPYILLAVVAVGGIVYYFKRNRKENA